MPEISSPFVDTPEMQDIHAYPAAAFATRLGDRALLRWALAKGADPHRPCERGERPLRSACRLGRGDCLQALADHGALSSQLPDEIEKLAALCMLHDSAHCISILIDAGAIVDAPMARSILACQAWNMKLAGPGTWIGHETESAPQCVALLEAHALRLSITEPELPATRARPGI